MPNPIFPKTLDNATRLARPALWILALLSLLKLAMSLNWIFNGRQVAIDADGIPLDTFPPAAAQAILAVFAVWALAHGLIALLGFLALARYRAMVPLAFVLLLTEHAGRKVVFHYLPLPRTGEPPAFAINVGLFALEIVGLGLALWRRDGAPAEA